MKPIATPSAILSTRVFPDELLNHYRRQMDLTADAVIAAVAQAEGPAGIGRLMKQLTPKADEEPKEILPQAVQAFFDQNQTLPDWADAKKLQEGMAFFEKRKTEIAVILGMLSLPYTYLGADGVQVLMLSGRMQNDTLKRLQETGEFVFSVTSPKAWKNGVALRRIGAVRLIHASVRWFCDHSGRWNEAWGAPVNQEDMAATNLAFSWVVIKGLRRAGVPPSDEEGDAYLHLLNVVGYLGGVAEELLPQNLREAYVLEKAIARRHFKPSADGKLLTKALLRTLEDLMPTDFLKALPASQMRFLLGDEWADLLGVPEVPIEKRLVRLVPIQLFGVGQRTPSFTIR